MRPLKLHYVVVVNICVCYKSRRCILSPNSSCFRGKTGSQKEWPKSSSDTDHLSSGAKTREDTSSTDFYLSSDREHAMFTDISTEMTAARQHSSGRMCQRSKRSPERIHRRPSISRESSEQQTPRRHSEMVLLQNTHKGYFHIRSRSLETSSNKRTAQNKKKIVDSGEHEEYAVDLKHLNKQNKKVPFSYHGSKHSKNAHSFRTVGRDRSRFEDRPRSLKEPLTRASRRSGESRYSKHPISLAETEALSTSLSTVACHSPTFHTLKESRRKLLDLKGQSDNERLSDCFPRNRTCPDIELYHCDISPPSDARDLHSNKARDPESMYWTNKHKHQRGLRPDINFSNSLSPDMALHRRYR